MDYAKTVFTRNASSFGGITGTSFAITAMIVLILWRGGDELDDLKFYDYDEIDGNDFE